MEDINKLQNELSRFADLYREAITHGLENDSECDLQSWKEFLEFSEVKNIESLSYEYNWVYGQVMNAIKTWNDEEDE